MSVQEAQRLQEELAPADDLSAYLGQWVALREGHVVASDIDPARLLDNPEVDEGDLVVFVSEDPRGVYVL